MSEHPVLQFFIYISFIFHSFKTNTNHSSIKLNSHLNETVVQIPQNNLKELTKGHICSNDTTHDYSNTGNYRAGQDQNRH